MTIVMTEKNQVTIPKKITNILGLKRGAMFNIEIHKSRIELVPVEVKKIFFSTEQYKKLEKLSRAEKGREKKVTPQLIVKLKKGLPGE
jgi:AbrB family looped-hinge helix DNA binding protein